MNISMQLAVVAVAACLCLAEGAPDGRLVRSKQQRPTRGFKNVEMMTARGFGKRDRSASRTEHYIIEVPRRKFNPKSSLMVASDFGKRSGNDDSVEEEEEIRHTRGDFKTKNILIARGYGKRDDEDNERVYNMDNIWELLDGSAEKEGQDGTEEKTIESIPLEWFTNEILNNPELARSVVRKFIDLNQDSMLSSDELLRNTV